MIGMRTCIPLYWSTPQDSLSFGHSTFSKFKFEVISNDHERCLLINSRMWTDRPTGYVREKRCEVNVETERPHGADPKRLRPPDDRISTDEILQ